MLLTESMVVESLNKLIDLNTGKSLVETKSVESIDIVEQINDDIELIKLEYPPVRKEGKIIGEGKEAVSELVRILREERNII